MRKYFNSKNITSIICLIQAILFCALLSLGVTGSSLKNIDSYGVVKTDARVVAGHAQLIRSDEWTVATPSLQA